MNNLQVFGETAVSGKLQFLDIVFRENVFRVKSNLCSYSGKTRSGKTRSGNARSDKRRSTKKTTLFYRQGTYLQFKPTIQPIPFPHFVAFSCLTKCIESSLSGKAFIYLQPSLHIERTHTAGLCLPFFFFPFTYITLSRFLLLPQK